MLIRRKELEQESVVESIEVILVCSENLTSLRLNCSVMLSDQVISHYLKTYPLQSHVHRSFLHTCKVAGSNARSCDISSYFCKYENNKEPRENLRKYDQCIVDHVCPTC